MKEIDDTPVPETESIAPEEKLAFVIAMITEKLAVLELRISNLEVQRTPADNNMDDPEWY